MIVAQKRGSKRGQLLLDPPGEKKGGYLRSAGDRD